MSDMNSEEMFELLLDIPEDILDSQNASGLIIEVTIPATDFVQAIGPYPKDSPEVVRVVERLKAEAHPCEESPASFRIVWLFPPSYANVPK